MKSRTLFFMTVGLLILILSGIALLILSTRNQETTQIIPATVNRDCAPWDGSAFTVSIPVNDGAILNISIWQSPDITLPARFSFPDRSMRVGNVLLLLPMGSPAPLAGSVYFQKVEQGMPVEGGFDLITETGERFKGRFVAGWGNEVVYCG